MKCPYCPGKTEVTNSRPTKQGLEVWRRRLCQDCLAEWTTREKTDNATAFRVRNSQGVLTPFSHVKLLISIYEACKHRKTALQDAEALTETVISNLRASQNAIWETSRIKDKTYQTLNRLDSTAAALYKALNR